LDLQETHLMIWAEAETNVHKRAVLASMKAILSRVCAIHRLI
jgi:hypothetical protein